MKKFYQSIRLLQVCAVVGLACAPYLSAAQYTTAAAYPFIASEEPFTYLSSGTTVTTIYQDDAQTSAIPIGFTFKFCNVDYTEVSVSSNGWMSFSSTTAFGSGICNDNRAMAQMVTYNSMPALFPFWDDLGYFVGGVAKYSTDNVGGSKVFTFEWRGWTWDFLSTPGTLSFQVKLYETGSIKYSYKRESGPISSDYSGTSGQAGWFGASIGLASSPTDYQFLDGSTNEASPIYSPTAYKTNIDARPFTDQSFMWLAPCSNMTAVNIVAPKEVCAGKTFRLGAVAQPTAVATSCNWSYSDDGNTWVPMSSHSGIITDVITERRWYKVQANCGSTGMFSQPVLVELAGHYNCYCKSGATTLTNGNGSAADIGSVLLETYPTNNTLINTSEPSVVITNNPYSVKGYTDFRRDFVPAVIYRDSTYQVSVQGINWRNFVAGNISVFIDYNRNGTFDAWEEMLASPTSNIPPVPFGAVRDTFTIPDTAKIGITGMRVVYRPATATDACNTYGDGETEDYLVNISYPPCDGPVDAGTAIISDSNMCIGYDYTVIDTTYEKLQTGIARLWQASADQAIWVDVANSAGKDSLVRMFTGQPTYYRVRTICSNTLDTTYSNNVFINSKPSYKCYCHSQSEGGYGDTSDVGSFRLATFSVNDGGGHLENPRAIRKRQDYTDLPAAVLDVDSTYQFYVFQTQPNKQHADAKITIFVDFNNNKIYDIPAERIFTGFTTVGTFVHTGAVPIPANVITDVPTGLRVIVNNDIAPNAASDEGCGEYASGETEDYILMFHRNFPVAVGSVTALSNLSIYPNPSTGKFSLSFNAGDAGQVQVTVKNITGQQVFAHSYIHTGGNFNQQLDLGNYAKGIYMVEVSGNGSKAIQKLVIQ